MAACICIERDKPLYLRNWKIESRPVVKVWGPHASSYDGRNLLRITCNYCGSVWGNSNKNSPLWKFIGETPYSKSFGNSVQ